MKRRRSWRSITLTIKATLAPRNALSLYATRVGAADQAYFKTFWLKMIQL